MITLRRSRGNADDGNKSAFMHSPLSVLNKCEGLETAPSDMKAQAIKADEEGRDLEELRSCSNQQHHSKP